MAGYLHSVELALASRDLATPVPHMAVSPPWSGWEVPTSIHHASWADDYVHLQIAKTGDALLHHVVASAKVHVENASSVGMQLTFAVDKSAVLLSARVARTVAGPLCRDASGTLGFVVQDDVMGEHHFLPVVDSYRHLGGILTANGSPETDIAFRMAQANSTLRPLKRRLFKSQGIPLTVRCTLLRSLVISRFVFACATVDLHAAVHRRKWCRAYINCWRALCKHSWGDKPMRPMHCYHVLLHTGATSPLLAMVQARSTFLQRILRHGPAGLLHLLHVRWVHKVSDSWLVQLVQDLRGVAPYSSSARIVLDSPHPVREFIETFQSEPEWWRQQLRKAVKGFEQDLRDWQRQPSPSVSMPEEPVTLFQCRWCPATFSLHKHVAVHEARRHGALSPSRHYAYGPFCLSCMGFYHTPERVQYHLRQTHSCLRRCAQVVPALDLAKIRSIELAGKQRAAQTAKGHGRSFLLPNRPLWPMVLQSPLTLKPPPRCQKLS